MPSSSFHKGEALRDVSSNVVFEDGNFTVAHPDEDGIEVSSKLDLLSVGDVSAFIDGGIGRVGGGIRAFCVDGMVCWRVGVGRAVKREVAGAEWGCVSLELADVIPERNA